MRRCVHLRTLSLNFVISFILVCVSDGARQNLDSPVKAVNLGGWLVTEGWIKPSLFDGIPNKDYLDGTGLQFKSVTTKKYLCAESGGGTIIVANRTAASGWETFKLWRLNERTFRFRVFNKQFVGLDGINVVAVTNISTDSETLNIVKESNNSNLVRIKTSNGYYLQAKSEVVVTADISEVNGWRDDDPTVFELTIAGRMQGEFQLTNGYGPLKAPLVLKVSNHYWKEIQLQQNARWQLIRILRASEGAAETELIAAV